MIKQLMYSEYIRKLYPAIHKNIDPSGKIASCRTVTFQVTDSCNLSCSYCYQINKGCNAMSFETAKKVIDNLLEGKNGFEKYINLDNSPGIILDFIGGEPLLQIELIDQICDYFMDKAIEMNHPWALIHKFCICSNGILYFDEKVQKFMDKHPFDLSFNVTIDGNKELHDSCRKFPNGDPSYDIAIKAVNDWKSKGKYMGSKITISPENINYLYDAIIHMIELKYSDIYANCVFEDVWKSDEYPKIFYNKMKQVTDYLIDNKIYDSVNISLFNERLFHKIDEKDNKNYCGGTGYMMAISPNGMVYPCLRYMESSLGDERPPIIIGTVDGMMCTDEQKNCVDCLNKITRRSQSTDECFYCPIGLGCAWCSAHNYQVYGTPDKRTTFLCEMHKARSLANVYFWNKIYKAQGLDKRFEMHCPKEWALKIIDEKEYNMLLALSSI